MEPTLPLFHRPDEYGTAGRRKTGRAALAGLICLVLLTTGRVPVAPAQDFEAARPQVIEEVARLVESLPAERLAALGLEGAAPDRITLASPMEVFTIDRADLARTNGRAWGGLFKATGRAFYLVRVDGQPAAGVWLERRAGEFDILGVGERQLARALVPARDAAALILSQEGVSDPPEYRLLELNWAACRLLAVLVRDRLLIWPLPTAAAMLGLEPGLYPADQVRPLLIGRTGS